MRWLDGVTEISGHDSEQTPGDSEREGSLVCCSSWSCRVENNSETENNNKGTRNSAAELSKGKCNKKKVKGLKGNTGSWVWMRVKTLPFALSKMGSQGAGVTYLDRISTWPLQLSVETE